MGATRAQKIRLGIFLIVSTCLLVGILVYLLGASMLEIRDEYRVVLHGGSGGLEIGAQVKYNGIRVGRVETVTINREDPSEVFIGLSVVGGTPITVDTVAIPELGGITGAKVLSMTGGTKSSELLKPGSDIASADSDLSMITTKVVDISKKLEALLDNLVEITNSENADKVASVLTEVETSVKNVNKILDDQSGRIDSIITNVNDVTSKLNTTMGRVDQLVATVDKFAGNVATKQNVENIKSILSNANTTLETVNKRLSDEELGTTISSLNSLISSADVSILRLRTDMKRIVVDLERAIENINDFVQILVDNPAALISGRAERDRELK